MFLRGVSLSLTALQIPCINNITGIKLPRNWLNKHNYCYRRSIFGWNLNEHENEEELVLPMSFGFNCSQGALKSIAVSSSGVYLSCGGTDERIRLFNVAENRSMGELGLHEGAITALEFFEDSHMISGSDVRSLKLFHTIRFFCKRRVVANLIFENTPP